jgi:hypothetical protein
MADINFNTSPYFDDYDENKKYYRILFKPGVAVQARELTQLQTMLQKQIERFGKHIFQNGTIVYGGEFDVQDSIDYVRFVIPDTSNISGIENYIGKEITGENSGNILRAYISHAVVDTENFGTGIFYIRYLNSANVNNQIVSKFAANELISVSPADPTLSSLQIAPSSHIGQGSILTINEGIAFVNGYFIKYDRQTIVLEKFATNPSKRVYFQFDFAVVNSDEDVTLLDNARGFLNYNAPGADRLKADLSLVAVDLDTFLPDTDYAILFEIQDGNIVVKKDRTEYSKIYDELARRTYDESGDYVVRGLETYTREHLDTGANGGRFDLNQGGDLNLISVGIEPGVAYVKGYEVNVLSTRYVDVEKSTDSIEIENQISFVGGGNYLKINEITGIPNLDVGSSINLYNQAENRVSNLIEYTEAVNANSEIIGTAKISSALYESGVLGAADGQLRLYVYDVSMNSNSSFTDVRSIGNSSFFADVVTESIPSEADPEVLVPAAFLYDTVGQRGLLPVGSSNVKRLKTSTGATDTSYQYYNNQVVNITAGGLINIGFTVPNESIPFSGNNLDSLTKRSIFLSIDEDVFVDFNNAGRITGTTASNVITGTDTLFTYLNVGDKISVNGSIYKIASIQSNTSLTIVGNVLSNFTLAAYTKAYTRGDLIDLNSKGSRLGNVRRVDATSSSISIDLNEDFGVSRNAKIIYKVSRNVANQINKVLKPSRLVLLDCSSISDLTKLYLGFSDVYKIRQIRKSGTAFTSKEQGIDVTSLFTLNNGQTDSSYETAYLIPRTPVSAADYYMVELDYFDPNFTAGAGYFSVDSYPVNDSVVSDTTITTIDIPTYKTSTGGIANLRDFIDIRSVKTRTANDAIAIGEATTNPSKSTTVAFASSLKTPVPGTSMTYDYSFYLARRDVVVVNDRGDFSVIQGIPSINPLYPDVPNNFMAIANLYVPPYPSIAGTYARIIGRPAIGAQTKNVTYNRHTMREIGVIKERVKNLEYYNALNLLEKSAVELLVLDENGLDRFKNGVFVDGFIDHSLGDTTDENYSVAVDKVEQVIRPKFEMDSFSALSAEFSADGVITLPFTETSLITQKNVTTIRNIEQSVFRFIGTTQVYPSIDTWVDTKTVDKKIYTNDIPNEEVMTTEWGSWQTYQTGNTTGGKTVYNVYARKIGDRKFSDNNPLIATFSSYKEAVAFSKSNSPLLQSRGRTFIETSIEGSQTTTSTRSGIQTVLSVDEDLTQLGNFVTDVSIVPYIRPQSIKLYTQGLKAGTRMYVYFDNEDMTSYCTPVTLDDPNSNGLTDIDSLNGLGSEGSPLIVDDYGRLLCMLRLPSSGKQFRVGTKDIVITDSPTNAIDATTFAKSYFVASGLNSNSQNTILATETVVTTQTTVSESFSVTTPIVGKQTVEVFGPSCMAYSFFVNLPREVPGMFLTSVDVLIQAMHPTLGVWFEIREMSSDGGITRNQVPGSEVWMTRNDSRIKITQTPNIDDPNSYTRINFPKPLFLYNDTQYAFIIHTEGLNPSTYFWVSRLGETDVNTQTPVTGRQLTGTLFTTNNNLNWDMVPDVDLTVRFNRAKFDTQNSRTVIFKGKSYEFFDVENIPNSFFQSGELVKGSDILTIAFEPGEILEVGDVVVGANTTTSGTIISIDTENNLYYTNAHGFQVGESITKDSVTVGSIPSILNGQGAIREINRKRNTFQIENSNGYFFEGCVIKSRYAESAVQYTLPVGSFTTYDYTALEVRPSYILMPNESSVVFAYKGASEAGVIDAEFSRIQPNSTEELFGVKSIYSRKDEIAIFDGEKTFEISATLSTTSEYVAPVINNQLTNAVFIHNELDVLSEDDVNSGTGKYISKIITLAEGQDAEDLQVFLKEYRPVGTEVKVWARIRHELDIQPIREKDWIELTPTKPRFSAVGDRDDFIDAEYRLPEDIMTGQFGRVRYTTDQGVFETYIQFQIMIGLFGENAANYPKGAELRAIALQL